MSRPLSAPENEIDCDGPGHISQRDGLQNRPSLPRDVEYLHMWEDLIKGHLDGLILGVLEAEPLHGYGVMQAIRRSSQGGFDLPSGSIYPALRRLELAGFVRGHWSLANGRRRRTYQLTPRGRQELEEKRGSWRAFSWAVGSLLGTRA